MAVEHGEHQTGERLIYTVHREQNPEQNSLTTVPGFHLRGHWFLPQRGRNKLTSVVGMTRGP